MSPQNTTRRNFIKSATTTGALAITGTTLMNTSPLSAAHHNPTSFVYVGTYTKKESKGIYRFNFNNDTGALTNSTLVAETENPSFLTLHPNGRWLFAVNETSTFNGQSAGSVIAYKIDPTTGALTPLGQAQSTHGASPCYISIDPTAKFALVANYNGGNIAAFPINKNGSLAQASDVIQHTGSSTNPKRQGEPHAHSILPDPKGASILAADLGIDKVMGYRLNAKTGKLIAHKPSTIKTEPGSGPRHLAIADNGKNAYAINELNSTITAMDYNRATGKLNPIQTLSTLPAGFTANSSCADLHIAPNGRFLYGSNRGHDSIAIFAINPQSGKLTPKGHASTNGKTPRNFGIDPSGKFLLAANQNSDTITTFKINQDTGALTPTNATAQVPTPVCLAFHRTPE